MQRSGQDYILIVKGTGDTDGHIEAGSATSPGNTVVMLKAARKMVRAMQKSLKARETIKKILT